MRGAWLLMRSWRLETGDWGLLKISRLSRSKIFDAKRQRGKGAQRAALPRRTGTTGRPVRLTERQLSPGTFGGNIPGSRAVPRVYKSAAGPHLAPSQPGQMAQVEQSPLLTKRLSHLLLVDESPTAPLPYPKENQWDQSHRFRGLRSPRGQIALR